MTEWPNVSRLFYIRLILSAAIIRIYSKEISYEPWQWQRATVCLKVAQSSFQHFPSLAFWWFIKKNPRWTRVTLYKGSSIIWLYSTFSFAALSLSAISCKENLDTQIRITWCQNLLFHYYKALISDSQVVYNILLKATQAMNWLWI